MCFLKQLTTGVPDGEGRIKSQKRKGPWCGHGLVSRGREILKGNFIAKRSGVFGKPKII
jgi:hypothetical protein